MTNIDRINSYRLYRTAGGLLLAGILTLAAIACSPPAAPDKTAASTATKAARARVAAANTDRGRATARLAAAGSNSPAPAASAAAGPGIVTRYAADAPGADWGAKLQYAIDGCPPGANCMVDATGLAGGVAAGDVRLATPNLKVVLGPARYEFSAHHRFKYQPRVGLSGPTSIVTGFELTGQGKDATVIACNQNDAGERCLDIEGYVFYSRGLSPLPLVGGSIGGTITAGTTSFAAAASDIAASNVQAGDWLMVGNFKVAANNKTFDFNGVMEQNQVRSVSATAITVTQPFKHTYGGTGAAAVWTRYKALLWRPWLHNLTVDATGSGAVGVYTLSTYGFRITDARIVAGDSVYSNGLVVGYAGAFELDRGEVVATSDVNLPIEIASCSGCAVRDTVFRCSSAAVRSDTPILDFGTNDSYFERNTLTCASSTGKAFAVIDADQNYIRGNNVLGLRAGSSVGIGLNGASGTLIGGNVLADFVVGFYVQNEPVAYRIPVWTKGTPYSPNSCVLAAPDNGFIFCTRDGGTAGSVQPRWRRQGSSAYGLAGTVTTDGTVTWTCGGRYQTANYNTFVNNRVFNIGTGIIFGPDTVGNSAIASQPWTSTGGLLSVD